MTKGRAAGTVTEGLAEASQYTVTQAHLVLKSAQ